MRIGIFGSGTRGRTALASLTEQVRSAHDAGFGSFWTPQIFGLDALTAYAVIGHEVPDITLGTAVVPTFPRHPSMLAQQALTVSQATGGRLRLGIGLSHKPVVEQMWGYSFDKPVQHLREYLDVLLPLLEGKPANVQGQQYRVNTFTDLVAPRPEVLVAALGSQMLKLCAERTDGTLLWMTGPATIATHTVPTLRAAAEAAGRPMPQVVAALPMCVTDDVAGARARADQVFAIYGTLPSYRAMMDKEGAAGPGDLAIVGDEATCRAVLDELAAAGVTEFGGSEFGTPEETARTRAFLRSVQGGA